MSQKSNKKPVKKAHTTEKIGTKFESQRQSNILQLTNENLDVFNFRNNYPSSQGYNTPTSNSSVGNDSDDDAKTVVMDESDNDNNNNNNNNNTNILFQNPENLNQSEHIYQYNSMSTPERVAYNKNLSPTILLDRKRNIPFYHRDGKPVTSANYIPGNTYYQNGEPFVPDMEGYVPRQLEFGGKRRRKTLRKTKRKTRKTRKTRRHRRRYTRKYK